MPFGQLIGRGAQGAQGEQGIQGEQGEQGEPGAAGAPGASAVTITGATASIDASDAADLTIALPAGVTRYYVIGASITMTGGTSQLASVRAYPTAARDTDLAMLFGNQFGGVDITGVDAPVYGPYDTTGGNLSRSGMAMASVGEFVYLTVHNNDGANSGAFSVSLDILPRGA